MRSRSRGLSSCRHFSCYYKTARFCPIAKYRQKRTHTVTPLHLKGSLHARRDPAPLRQHPNSRLPANCARCSEWEKLSEPKRDAAIGHDSDDGPCWTHTSTVQKPTIHTTVRPGQWEKKKSATMTTHGIRGTCVRRPGTVKNRPKGDHFLAR